MSKIISWKISEIKRLIWAYACPYCKEIMEVDKSEIVNYETCPACGSQNIFPLKNHTKDNKWKRKRKIIVLCFIQCSNCGTMLRINENELLKWKYCPKCGKPQIIEVKVEE